jgi:phosphoglycerate dehydrogenase-like enzyme
VLFDSVVDRREPLLREFLSTEWKIRPVPDRADLAHAQEQLRGAAALIGNEFPAALTAAGGQLRLIQCVGAGVDLFDLSAIPKGCALCNVYEHEIPIAEYVLLNVLLFAKRLIEHDAAMRQGRWPGSGRFEGEFHEEVCGKTIGLVGFGHIGAALAPRAKALGMRVIAVRRRPQPSADLDWCGATSELPRLLAESDYIAIVCPLTPETKGLIGEAQLRLLKPTAVLINPARAAIIDEEPLYRALNESWFAGAALDVWYQYPPPDSDTPLHGSRYPFHELPNVVVTPHYSAWTQAMIRRRYRKIAENLDHLARGEPLERIVYQA